MKISINEDVVIFTTQYSQPIPAGYFPQTIYLFRDSSPKFIGLNYLRSSQLYLDQNQDGLSSELIFTGGANLISPNELEIRIPRIYLPDIFSKQIWVESATDRLPDADFVTL